MKAECTRTQGPPHIAMCELSSTHRLDPGRIAELARGEMTRIPGLESSVPVPGAAHTLMSLMSQTSIDFQAASIGMRQHGVVSDDHLIPAHAADWLRQDHLQEYYAILEVVTGFDQRVMTIKGWSVTLSLAALGLGFQQGHYALFALAAVTGLGFWFIDATTKRHQLRYYARMRDIELAAYNLNYLALDVVDPKHEYQVPRGAVSAPRIDMYWSYPKGHLADWRTDVPWRRTPEEIQKMLRRAC